MVKLVIPCSVCGGRGKFLTQTCEKCRGLGGKLVPFDERSYFAIEPYYDKMSVQEKDVFEFYRRGLSQKEISRRMDISKNKVIFLLRSIEKRMKENEEKNIN